MKEEVEERELGPVGCTVVSGKPRDGASNALASSVPRSYSLDDEVEDAELGAVGCTVVSGNPRDDASNALASSVSSLYSSLEVAVEEVELDAVGSTISSVAGNPVEGCADDAGGVG